MNYPIVSMKGHQFRVSLDKHDIVLTSLIKGWIIKLSFSDFISGIIRSKINFTN